MFNFSVNRNVIPDYSYEKNIRKEDNKTAETDNSPLSYKQKICLGAVIIPGLIIAGDFVFADGKHIKSILGIGKKDVKTSNLQKIEQNKPLELKTSSDCEELTNPKTIENPKIKSAEQVEKVSESEIVQSEIKKIAGTDITAIQSDEEYLEILDRLKKNKYWRNEWNIEGASPYELGVVPYIHPFDMHEAINNFMRENKLLSFRYQENYPKDVIDDYIKVMDYALNKIDETYGAYQGVVYRYGLFTPELKAFTSTASTPTGAAVHAGGIRPYLQDYNIILTHNGTKIEEVQRKLGFIEHADKEQEIVLRPGHKFKEIETITPELEELKQKLFDTMKQEHGYLYEQDVKLHFWREI